MQDVVVRVQLVYSMEATMMTATYWTKNGTIFNNFLHVSILLNELYKTKKVKAKNLKAVDTNSVRTRKLFWFSLLSVKLRVADRTQNAVFGFVVDNYACHS